MSIYKPVIHRSDIHRPDIFRPDYYDDFVCIAGECTLTCCQEWKIYVDDKTLEHWKQTNSSATDIDSIAKYVTPHENEYIISLDNRHVCPFLNEQGLCRLVLAFGNGMLSETCATFPRQTHKFRSHIEYSLTSCCPVVTDYFNRGTPISFIGEPGINEPLFLLRKQMMALLQNPAYSCALSMSMMFYLLSIIYRSGSITQESLEEFTNQTALAELSAAINALPDASTDTLAECNELFLDMSENYRKEGLYTSYLEPIVTKSEQIATQYDDGQLLASWQMFHNKMNQYEMFFQNYLTAELFTSLLLPDSSLENMIAAFEWIGLEYSVLRQALFLRWLINSQTLSYETIRVYTCVIARMTGYDEADYCEYLENSFESLIWEWGYFHLILH